MRNKGCDLTGPLPPDTIFTESTTGIDAHACMYHDQALIPVKALASTKRSTPPSTPNHTDLG